MRLREREQLTIFIFTHPIDSDFSSGYLFVSPLSLCSANFHRLEALLKGRRKEEVGLALS